MFAASNSQTAKSRYRIVMSMQQVSWVLLHKLKKHTSFLCVTLVMRKPPAQAQEASWHLCDLMLCFHYGWKHESSQYQSVLKLSVLCAEIFSFTLFLPSLLFLSCFLKALHIWWQSKVCLSLCLCYESIFACDSVVLCCGCFWWCCSIYNVILLPLSPSFYCPKKTVTNKACFFWNVLSWRDCSYSGQHQT